MDNPRSLGSWHWKCTFCCQWPLVQAVPAHKSPPSPRGPMKSVCLLLKFYSAHLALFRKEQALQLTCPGHVGRCPNSRWRSPESLRGNILTRKEVCNPLPLMPTCPGNTCCFQPLHIWRQQGLSGWKCIFTPASTASGCGARGQDFPGLLQEGCQEWHPLVPAGSLAIGRTSEMVAPKWWQVSSKAENRD